MLKKFIKLEILSVIILLMMFVMVNISSAAGFIKDNTTEQIEIGTSFVGTTAGFESNVDLANIIGVVIQTFLGILGVIFLVYMLYAGYNWMIAQGDEERVTKAKETIRRAIIGLIVTIASYAISYWVFEKLITNTNIIN